MKQFLDHMTEELARQGYYKNYTLIKPSHGYRDHIQRKANLKSTIKNDAETLNVLKATGYLPNEEIAT
jgi:hypothetical protein